MAWYKYITVEVPLFLVFFCMMLQGNVSSNLMIYRTCYALLGYNETDCAQLGKEDNNITESLEKKVQPTVNHIGMVQNVINFLIPLIFSMYAGTWSDKFGRKPFILLCLIATTLTNLATTAIVFFENASPWWFLISSIPSLMAGGSVTLIILISSYMTDVSTPETRVARMVIFEIVMGFGTFLGNLVASYLLYSTDYITVYIILTCLIGFASVYTFFFIPESIQSEKEVPKLKNLLKYINIVDLTKSVFKQRPNNGRRYLLAIFGIVLVQTFSLGELGVNAMYLRAKLNWTLSQITVTSSVTSVGNILGTIGGTYLLYSVFKIKELKVALLSILAFIASNILRSIATKDKDYFIYIASSIGAFSDIQGIMIRTIISYLVELDEIGKIFALQSLIINVNLMLSNLTYQAIYNATLDTNSGTFYYLSATVNSLAGIGMLLLLSVKAPVNPEAVKEAEKSEKGAEESEKGAEESEKGAEESEKEFKEISVNNIDELLTDEKQRSNSKPIEANTITE